MSSSSIPTDRFGIDLTCKFTNHLSSVQHFSRINESTFMTCDETTIRVWDINGKELRRLNLNKRKKNTVSCMTYIPQYKLSVICEVDGSIKLYSERLEVLDEFKVKEKPISVVSFVRPSVNIEPTTAALDTNIAKDKPLEVLIALGGREGFTIHKLLQLKKKRADGSSLYPNYFDLSSALSPYLPPAAASSREVFGIPSSNLSLGPGIWFHRQVQRLQLFPQLNRLAIITSLPNAAVYLISTLTLLPISTGIEQPEAIHFVDLERTSTLTVRALVACDDHSITQWQVVEPSTDDFLSAASIATAAINSVGSNIKIFNDDAEEEYTQKTADSKNILPTSRKNNFNNLNLISNNNDSSNRFVKPNFRKVSSPSDYHEVSSPSRLLHGLKFDDLNGDLPNEQPSSLLISKNIQDIEVDSRSDQNSKILNEYNTLNSKKERGVVFSPLNVSGSISPSATSNVFSVSIPPSSSPLVANSPLNSPSSIRMSPILAHQSQSVTPQKMVELIVCNLVEVPCFSKLSSYLDGHSSPIMLARFLPSNFLTSKAALRSCTALKNSIPLCMSVSMDGTLSVWAKDSCMTLFKLNLPFAVRLLFDLAIPDSRSLTMSSSEFVKMAISQESDLQVNTNDHLKEEENRHSLNKRKETDSSIEVSDFLPIFKKSPAAVVISNTKNPSGVSAAGNVDGREKFIGGALKNFSAMNGGSVIGSSSVALAVPSLICDDDIHMLENSITAIDKLLHIAPISPLNGHSEKKPAAEAYLSALRLTANAGKTLISTEESDLYDGTQNQISAINDSWSESNERKNLEAVFELFIDPIGKRKSSSGLLTFQKNSSDSDIRVHDKSTSSQLLTAPNENATDKKDFTIPKCLQFACIPRFSLDLGAKNDGINTVSIFNLVLAPLFISSLPISSVIKLIADTSSEAETIPYLSTLVKLSNINISLSSETGHSYSNLCADIGDGDDTSTQWAEIPLSTILNNEVSSKVSNDRTNSDVRNRRNEKSFKIDSMSQTQNASNNSDNNNDFLFPLWNLFKASVNDRLRLTNQFQSQLQKNEFELSQLKYTLSTIYGENTTKIKNANSNNLEDKVACNQSVPDSINHQIKFLESSISNLKTLSTLILLPSPSFPTYNLQKLFKDQPLYVIMLLLRALPNALTPKLSFATNMRLQSPRAFIPFKNHVTRGADAVSVASSGMWAMLNSDNSVRVIDSKTGRQRGIITPPGSTTMVKEIALCANLNLAAILLDDGDIGIFYMQDSAILEATPSSEIQMGSKGGLGALIRRFNVKDICSFDARPMNMLGINSFTSVCFFFANGNGIGRGHFVGDAASNSGAATSDSFSKELDEEEFFLLEEWFGVDMSKDTTQQIRMKLMKPKDADEKTVAGWQDKIDGLHFKPSGAIGGEWLLAVGCQSGDVLFIRLSDIFGSAGSYWDLICKHHKAHMPLVTKSLVDDRSRAWALNPASSLQNTAFYDEGINERDDSFDNEMIRVLKETSSINSVQTESFSPKNSISDKEGKLLLNIDSTEKVEAPADSVIKDNNIATTAENSTTLYSKKQTQKINTNDIFNLVSDIISAPLKSKKKRRPRKKINEKIQSEQSSSIKTRSSSMSAQFSKAEPSSKPLKTLRPNSFPPNARKIIVKTRISVSPYCISSLRTSGGLLISIDKEPGISLFSLPLNSPCTISAALQSYLPQNSLFSSTAAIDTASEVKLKLSPLRLISRLLLGSQPPNNEDPNPTLTQLQSERDSKYFQTMADIRKFPVETYLNFDSFPIEGNYFNFPSHLVAGLLDIAEKEKQKMGENGKLNPHLMEIMTDLYELSKKSSTENGKENSILNKNNQSSSMSGFEHSKIFLANLFSFMRLSILSALPRRHSTFGGVLVGLPSGHVVKISLNCPSLEKSKRMNGKMNDSMDFISEEFVDLTSKFSLKESNFVIAHTTAAVECLSICSSLRTFATSATRDNASEVKLFNLDTMAPIRRIEMPLEVRSLSFTSMDSLGGGGGILLVSQDSWVAQVPPEVWLTSKLSSTSEVDQLNAENVILDTDVIGDDAEEDTPIIELANGALSEKDPSVNEVESGDESLFGGDGLDDHQTSQEKPSFSLSDGPNAFRRKSIAFVNSSNPTNSNSKSKLNRKIVSNPSLPHPADTSSPSNSPRKPAAPFPSFHRASSIASLPRNLVNEFTSLSSSPDVEPYAPAKPLGNLSSFQEFIFGPEDVLAWLHADDPARAKQVFEETYRQVRIDMHEERHTVREAARLKLKKDHDDNMPSILMLQKNARNNQNIQRRTSQITTDLADIGLKGHAKLANDFIPKLDKRRNFDAIEPVSLPSIIASPREPSGQMPKNMPPPIRIQPLSNSVLSKLIPQWGTMKTPRLSDGIKLNSSDEHVKE